MDSTNQESEEICKKLKIITYGKYFRNKPKESEKNYDLMNISEKQENYTESHKLDTRNKKYKRKVSQSSKYKNICQEIIEDIENNNYNCISINCFKGKNRSVAMARTIQTYYPDAEIINLDINS